jgi:hypothetical protein
MAYCFEPRIIGRIIEINKDKLTDHKKQQARKKDLSPTEFVLDSTEK